MYGKVRNLLRSICLRRRLNELGLFEVTRSFGREFQMGTMRLEKRNFLVFVLTIGTQISVNDLVGIYLG